MMVMRSALVMDTAWLLHSSATFTRSWRRRQLPGFPLQVSDPILVPHAIPIAAFSCRGTDLVCPQKPDQSLFFLFAPPTRDSTACYAADCASGRDSLRYSMNFVYSKLPTVPTHVPVLTCRAEVA
jgi:hypothetical protein